VEISEHVENETVSALVSGLSCDGAQHKQYYLDKALLHFVGRKTYEDIKEREDWENGLPA
jgi:hypothetical protein